MRLVPSNFNPVNDQEWMWQDLQIAFTLETRLPYPKYFSFAAPSIQLAIPSAYSVNTYDDIEFYCFTNFLAYCDLSSNTIVLSPKIAVGGNVREEYRVTLLRGVVAPEDNYTTVEYAFGGVSYYAGAVIDEARELVIDDQYHSMYAKLTDQATQLTEGASLSVYPRSRGEYAYYTVQFTHSEDEDIASDQEIWVMFDYLNYDYYVADVEVRFENQVDRDGEQVYYLPCVATLDDSDPLSTALCTAKKHTIRVNLGVNVVKN